MSLDSFCVTNHCPVYTKITERKQCIAFSRDQRHPQNSNVVLALSPLEEKVTYVVSDRKMSATQYEEFKGDSEARVRFSQRIINCYKMADQMFINVDYTIETGYLLTKEQEKEFIHQERKSKFLNSLIPRVIALRNAFGEEKIQQLERRVALSSSVS